MQTAGPGEKERERTEKVKWKLALSLSDAKHTGNETRRWRRHVQHLGKGCQWKYKNFIDTKRTRGREANINCVCRHLRKLWDSSDDDDDDADEFSARLPKFFNSVRVRQRSGRIYLSSIDTLATHTHTRSRSSVTHTHRNTQRHTRATARRVLALTVVSQLN